MVVGEVDGGLAALRQRARPGGRGIQRQGEDRAGDAGERGKADAWRHFKDTLKCVWIFLFYYAAVVAAVTFVIVFASMGKFTVAQVRARGLAGVGRVRVNIAGCLDRCQEGPTVVVYPEGVWYRIATREDVDELIERHLVGGEPVERLRIAP